MSFTRTTTILVCLGLGLGCGASTPPPEEAPAPKAPPKPAPKLDLPPPVVPDPAQLPPLVEGVASQPQPGVELALDGRTFFVAHDHGAGWVFSVTSSRMKTSTLIDQTVTMVSDAGVGEATITGVERLSDTLWFTVETTVNPAVKEAWLTTQAVPNPQARLTPTPQSAVPNTPEQRALIAELAFGHVRAALSPEDQTRIDGLGPLPATAYRIYSPRLPKCGRLVLVSGDASPTPDQRMAVSGLLCLDDVHAVSMTIVAPQVDRRLSLVGFADLDGDGVDELVVEEDSLGEDGGVLGVRMGLYRWSTEQGALERTELTDADYK